MPKSSNGDIISTYINLKYIKQISDVVNTNEPLSIQNLHFMDLLFDVNTLFGSNSIVPSNLIPWNTSLVTKWHVFDDEVFIDKTSGYGSGSIGKVGLAEDPTSFYLLCFVNGDDILNGGVGVPINSGYSATSSFLEIIKTVLPLNIQKINIETATGNLVNGIKSNQRDVSSNNIPLVPSLESVIMIALNKEIDIPKLNSSLSNFNGDFRKRLAIREIEEQVDINGDIYFSGEIHIIGHHIEVDGSLIVKSEFTNINFYFK